MAIHKYLYGNKRLCQNVRSIRFLAMQLDRAKVGDPSAHHDKDQIYCGAPVTSAPAERTITMNSLGEAAGLQGKVRPYFTHCPSPAEGT